MKMKVMGDDGNASLEVVTQRMRMFESAKRELDMIQGKSRQTPDQSVHTLNSYT